MEGVVSLYGTLRIVELLRGVALELDDLDDSDELTRDCDLLDDDGLLDKEWRKLGEESVRKPLPFWTLF